MPKRQRTLLTFLLCCGFSSACPPKSSIELEGLGAKDGEPCTGGDRCLSGQCADGYCCNAECAGACEACDLPDHLGACSPLAPDAVARHGACVNQGVGPCGGRCDGVSAACAYPAVGVACGAECTSATEEKVSACDGAGACVAQAPVACANHLQCGATQCLDTCIDVGDCELGYVCQPSGACIGHCTSGLKDLDETDTDCGGTCSPCAQGKLCSVTSDCETPNVCSVGLLCAPHCESGLLDGDEIDVDCGGECGPCRLYQSCNGNNDCQNKNCVSNRCVQVSGPPYWWEFNGQTGVYNAAIAIANGKLYTIGGEDMANDIGLLVQVYDLETNTWEANMTLPFKIAGAVGAVDSDDNVYAIGSYYGYSALKYNVSDGWTSFAALPDHGDGSRFAAGAVIAPDGKLYGFGGSYCAGPTECPVAHVDGISLSSGAVWDTSLPPLPEARDGPVAAMGTNGRVYVFGGTYPDKEERAETFSSIPGGTWSSRASMSTARAIFAGASAPDGRIYAIGGLDFDPGGDVALKSVEAYVPEIDKWFPVADLPYESYYMDAAVGPNGNIYVAGSVFLRYGPMIDVAVAWDDDMKPNYADILLDGMNFAASANVKLFVDTQVRTTGIPDATTQTDADGDFVSQLGFEVPGIAGGTYYYLTVIDDRSFYPAIYKFVMDL